MEILLNDDEVLFLKILCTIEKNNLNNFLLINKHKSSDDLDVENCILNIKLVENILDKLD